ncbi:hypothetical protein GCM10010174_36610 [Kutzneria viridogrisea]|uniref:Peptidase inhibitor family I36 n=2 Tax=Kutzneria TaxID=43356 RepID=A0ABR6BU55_9PSEU|nr:hypothetical protein [Kutzneria albida]AHH94785.1 putative secreted protein [Kutzneria albida DSM 43870]MBA8930454.1 hypothetical protein [Kutzneria viridogrisea]
MHITLVRAAAAAALALTAVAGPASAADDDTVIGPDGFGPLKVGMSLADAKATGKVRDAVGGNELCRGYNWTYSEGPMLIISAKFGVYSVAGSAPDAHTPEGVRVGSTTEQVRTAYPKATTSASNGVEVFITPTPQNPDNRYVFGLRDGKVVGFALQSVDAHDCAAG